jgi:hypothetical protein
LFNNLTGIGEDSSWTNPIGDDSTVDPSKTITSAAQIQVHLNGVQQVLNVDYTVDLAGTSTTADDTTSSSDSSSLTTDIAGSPDRIVFTNAPNANDLVAITTLVDYQYYNIGTDIILDPVQLSADGNAISANDVLSVTTINNALGSKQRREVLAGTVATSAAYPYTVPGKFNLRFEPLNEAYTFVWLNGEQLVQGYDYTLNRNTITVLGRTIVATDRLDVLYFALDSAVSATGFRIFKDMLNRTFYKRISKTATTKLTLDMTVGTQTLTVEDASVLPTPNIASNTPGVVFIDKERIEYFTKSGNTLGQLRRGTLGTGIKDHGSGAEVVDASGTQTIPYADTVHTNTFTGDGSTVTFALSQTPSSASELDIFIGGQRLLLTSEDGSTINYSVSGSNVTLSTAPASGTQVKILHKKGQVWYTAKDGNPADGRGLQASTTQQAKFIANEPTNAPE